MTRQTNSGRPTKSRSGSLPMIRRRLVMAFAMLVVMLVAAVAVLATISFISKWGTSGSTDGQFLTPRGMATDAAGKLQICQIGTGDEEYGTNGKHQREMQIRRRERVI